MIGVRRIGRRAVRRIVGSLAAGALLIGVHDAARAVTDVRTRHILPTWAPDATPTAKGPGPVLADGHGWTPAGIEGPVPAAGSCHYRHVAGGQVLPDPACTPGATDPAVRSSTLSSTVCRRGGYAASVRPPEQLTEAVKRQVMAAYGLPWSQASHYELDHLVELSAGGASDIRNLWPEPNTLLSGAAATQFIHNDKDAVEFYTFDALCAGRVSLPALQRAVAANWTTAVAALGLPAIPKGYRG